MPNEEFDLNHIGETLPDETPLYTSPDTSELRKAAEKMRTAIAGLPMLVYCDLKEEYEALCAALDRWTTLGKPDGRKFTAHKVFHRDCPQEIEILLTRLSPCLSKFVIFSFQSLTSKALL